MKYYKLLNDNNTDSYSNFKWDLSGKWMSVKGDLIMSVNGFHVLRVKDIMQWLSCGFNLYEVEIKGDRLIDKVNICVRSVRVLRKVDNYNKQSLLNKVIRPAIKRAKKYAAAYARAADAAYACAADAASAYAAAAYACAADAAADAAAAYARAAYADDAAAYAAEQKLQIRDLRKLLK